MRPAWNWIGINIPKDCSDVIMTSKDRYKSKWRDITLLVIITHACSCYTNYIRKMVRNAACHAKPFVNLKEGFHFLYSIQFVTKKKIINESALLKIWWCWGCKEKGGILLLYSRNGINCFFRDCSFTHVHSTSSNGRRMFKHSMKCMKRAQLRALDGEDCYILAQFL